MQRFLFVLLLFTPFSLLAQVADLQQLNTEYIKLLTKMRTERSHRQQQVVFDAGLLTTAQQHNRVMQQRDTLYHSLTLNSELCGNLWDIARFKGDAAKLAAHIFDNLDKSKTGHAQIQINPEYRFVAISCTEKYYVVQLSSSPSN